MILKLLQTYTIYAGSTPKTEIAAPISDAMNCNALQGSGRCQKNRDRHLIQKALLSLLISMSAALAITYV